MSTGQGVAAGSGIIVSGVPARRHLVDGSDTRRIATEMFLSEHTVQDHLKSIFAKTATHNRRTLLARAAGR